MVLLHEKVTYTSTFNCHPNKILFFGSIEQYLKEEQHLIIVCMVGECKCADVTWELYLNMGETLTNLCLQVLTNVCFIQI